jgi:RNA polymerase sigma-70 factor, ECF subfamily
VSNGARAGGSERKGVAATMHDDADERELFAAIAAGRRDAAERFVDLTYARVFALLARLCDGDADLAADLTQESYRKAWAALASFNGEARFSTWLYRIAYNTFLNHLRDGRRSEPLDDETAAGVPDGRRSVDEDLLDDEAQRRVRGEVMRLPDELRTTVAARYWAEVPVVELARLEGISETAVRKRLRRALRMLGQALGGALGRGRR